MNTNDIQHLFAYNRWANGSILDAIAALPAEKFSADLASSYRSVRNTLTHIMSAEWIWLMRCKGTSPKQMLDPADFPDLLALRTRWAEVDQELKDFTESLSEDSLERIVKYTNFRGEVWSYPLSRVLQHLVNHSTYHRGQVTTLMRCLDCNPVMTDYLFFIDVQGM